MSPVSVQVSERVLGVRSRDLRLNVRRQANLERDASGPGEEVRVLEEARAVPDSARPSELNHLPNLDRTEALTCVDRNRKSGGLRRVDRVEVISRRVPSLSPRHIVPAHSPVAVRDCQLGHLKGAGRGQPPQRAHDHAGLDLEVLFGAGEAGPARPQAPRPPADLRLC